MCYPRGNVGRSLRDVVEISERALAQCGWWQEKDEVESKSKACHISAL